MAEGALARLGGDIGVAVSGIAGPDGGTQEKPIGLVCFAWSRSGAGPVATITHREIFPGDREQVRRQTVAYALERILRL
jgi:nicotinamide-nucleotide amidase